MLIHGIFSAKDRHSLLDESLRPDLFAYMGGILRQLRIKPHIINGTDNHIHFLASLPGDKSIADTMRILKTNSSRWVHEKNEKYNNFAWQTGYGAFSVSHSNLDSVYQYIKTQVEHHRTVTFEEEFLAFLKKHHIEYDERYIWG
jgi:REP element-mobilizing transposase RayT